MSSTADPAPRLPSHLGHVEPPVVVAIDAAVERARERVALRAAEGEEGVVGRGARGERRGFGLSGAPARAAGRQRRQPHHDEGGEESLQWALNSQGDLGARASRIDVRDAATLNRRSHASSDDGVHRRRKPSGRDDARSIRLEVEHSASLDRTRQSRKRRPVAAGELGAGLGHGAGRRSTTSRRWCRPPGRSRRGRPRGRTQAQEARREVPASRAPPRRRRRGSDGRRRLDHGGRQLASPRSASVGSAAVRPGRPARLRGAADEASSRDPSRRRRHHGTGRGAAETTGEPPIGSTGARGGLRRRRRRSARVRHEKP